METPAPTTLPALLASSGLHTEIQASISVTLSKFFAKTDEWNSTVDTIIITDPTDVGKMKMAREGRLFLKNLRLDAEEIVKLNRDNLKFVMNDFLLQDKLWLKAGQMMVAAFKHLETRLEEKEKFAEIYEAQQAALRASSRRSILAPLGYSDDQPIDLGNLTEEVFQSIRLGFIARNEEKIAAEKQRAEAERKDAEERENTRLDNIKLRERETALLIEQNKERDRMKKESDEKIAEIERVNRLAREVADAQAKKLRLENEALAEAARQEKLRIEGEQKAAARLAKKQAAAPDVDKMLLFVNTLRCVQAPTCSSNEGKALAARVQRDLTTFCNNLCLEINNLL